MDDIISRDEARSKGLARFFNGVPCRNGHIADRYVARGNCVVCKAEAEKRWYNNKQDTVLEYRKKLRADPHHKQKQSEKAKEWREKNKDAVKAHRDQWYKNHPDYHSTMRNRPDKRPSRMLSEAKRRAKSAGLDFNITVDDIVIPDICPVLGIPIMLDGPRNNVPSLDRIDNTKGYVKGNVCVISMRANNLKMNGTVEEFEAIISYMKRFMATTQPL